ncbi:hypothetical protein ACFE04_019137 [Oxalis oulophora]
MQRQKSILSFFQKSPGSSKDAGARVSNGGASATQFPANQRTTNDSDFNKNSVPMASDSSFEVRGTETPPEKEPRRLFPSGSVEKLEAGGSSLFASIMHKFVKVDDRAKQSQKNQSQGGTSNVRSVSNGLGDPVVKTVAAAPRFSKRDNTLSFGKKSDRDSVVLIESDNDDILGPETPGMRPLVPRLKRISDQFPKFEIDSVPSLINPNKRVKFVEDQMTKVKNQGDTADVISKFEWLDSSQVKDAKGRRPGDPLYDKNTLFIPPDALRKMSASQKQYWSVKCQYMDVVLFFKVGKFYELYEIDAEIGHKELGWKMTISGVGKCRQVGISESGIDEAVQKLVACGYKVGRIEQLETSDQAKARGANSVIQRKLTHVITPSTVTEGNVGPDAVHLLAIKEGNLDLENGSIVYGFAFVDCAALKFWVGFINDDGSCAALGALLMQISPKEVIYESGGLSKETQKALRKYSITGSSAVQLTPLQAVTDFLDVREVRNLIELKGYFKGSSIFRNNALDNVLNHEVTLGALGGLAAHLSRLMLDDVLRNGDIFPYQVYKGCLRMDGQTLVNLEVFGNSADGGPSGTLFKYLDSCMTASGKRLLRRWICHPLKDIEGINNRLNVVEKLTSNPDIMAVVAQYMKKIPDLERLLGRVKASIKTSAAIILPMVGKKILKQRVKSFGSLVKGLRIGLDLLMLLQQEGDILSLLSKVFKLPLLHGGDGLHNFLIQFVAAIDSDFPNYQNHELTDSDAETLTVLIELFVEKATQWSEVIYAISCIDVLRSFSVTASMSAGSMCRSVILPQSMLNQGTRRPILKIKGLWHPFALGVTGGLPVPNDIVLGDDSYGYSPHALLLTGPNMGGKSTLLRATCIAVILAQLGCFVPGEMCSLSIVDIVFTRLGAIDRIMTGESTFFVECTETSSVLQNATQDSLVLLDELGRGTSTFDGYAIAYAVFRHLVEKVNCRLLFATHYHPLTKEFGSHPHVTLQHMACALKSDPHSPKSREELVFLYRLTSGACPESYGLQVAVMAGIPRQVVDAASQAAQVMKKSIGKSFKSSEQRSELSTLHEDWLKSLLNISRNGVGNVVDEDDAYDSLFCLWHELKSAYQSRS